MGRDQELLESLVAEVEKNVDGRRVTVEGEDDDEAKEQCDISSIPTLLVSVSLTGVQNLFSVVGILPCRFAKKNLCRWPIRHASLLGAK
jgi:hypothetical protein